MYAFYLTKLILSTIIEIVVLYTYRFEIRRCEVTAFDGQITQQSLLIRLFQNIFLDSPFADQSINVHILRLTDTMATILSLSVHRRIPIGIVKYHSICSCQVDTYTSGSRRQDESEYSAVSIKPFHKNLENMTNYKTCSY